MIIVSICIFLDSFIPQPISRLLMNLRSHKITCNDTDVDNLVVSGIYLWGRFACCLMPVPGKSSWLLLCIDKCALVPILLIVGEWRIYASLHTWLNWLIIGSGNGLSPVRCQAITWTNDDLLLIGPSWTALSEISIGILTYLLMKMYFCHSRSTKVAYDHITSHMCFCHTDLARLYMITSRFLT